MQSDLISRRSMLEQIEEYIEEYSEVDSNGLHNLKWCAMEEAKAVLEREPAVDAVPVVRARWQGVSPFVDTEECSHCGYNIPSDEFETLYCPWCGAKMDGEANVVEN